MQTTKQLQRFYVVEVFRPQPPIPGSQGSETVSLPCGASAFDRAQYTTRDNRMLIEGTSPSIRIRSRIPLHSSLAAMDGFPSRRADDSRLNTKQKRNLGHFTSLPCRWLVLRPLGADSLSGISKGGRAGAKRYVRCGIPLQAKACSPLT